jgi:hypothetical protein
VINSFFSLVTVHYHVAGLVEANLTLAFSWIVDMLFIYLFKEFFYVLLMLFIMMGIRRLDLLILAHGKQPLVLNAPEYSLKQVVVERKSKDEFGQQLYECPS